MPTSQQQLNSSSKTSATDSRFHAQPVGTELSIGRLAAAVRNSSFSIPPAIFRPLVLLVSDASALAVALMIAVAVKSLFIGSVPLGPYMKLWPFTFVFLCSYWMSGLYSQPALSQPEDLERGTACSFCIFLSLAASTLTMRGGSRFFTFALGTCIVANAILMPLFRELARHLFSKSRGWGYQAVIFGSGDEARALIERSRSQKEGGLHPVAVVDPNHSQGPFVCGLPIKRSLESAARFLDKSSPAYGLLTVSAASSEEIVRLLKSPEATIFSRIVLVSNPSAMSSLWAMPLSRRHTQSLNTRSRVESLSYRLAKRPFDMLVSGALLTALFPIMALISVAIKLGSRGPVFFGHERIGKQGNTFKTWKFRTMRVNSRETLDTWILENPAAREEWARSGKLQNDPRVTTIGKFLRSTSLDELPQLWNVLRGDMSLVGPRPIVEEEIERYGEDYKVFSRAQGGVTGLWQVSGRSSTSYNERVMLDTFYVQNWSIWLDLSIMIRTIGAVLLRKGAV
jgi:Undecaprenyl-phosphate galactose phosphotransferase WbaP